MDLILAGNFARVSCVEKLVLDFIAPSPSDSDRSSHSNTKGMWKHIMPTEWTLHFLAACRLHVRVFLFCFVCLKCIHYTKYIRRPFLIEAIFPFFQPINHRWGGGETPSFRPFFVSLPAFFLDRSAPAGRGTWWF